MFLLLFPCCHHHLIRPLQTLQTIQLDLDPFAQLWLTSMDFKLALPDWKFGPFLQLNADDVQASDV